MGSVIKTSALSSLARRYIYLTQSDIRPIIRIGEGNILSRAPRRIPILRTVARPRLHPQWIMRKFGYLALYSLMILALLSVDASLITIISMFFNV